MRRPILALLLVVLGSTVALRAGNDSQSVSPVATEPLVEGGEYELAVATDDSNRPYILYLPQSYSAATPVPLVLFFHGGGGDMRQAMSYDFQETAEQHGFAVAFLNGTSPFRGGRLATWNAGTCCGRARDNNIDDVAYSRAVVADVKNRIAVAENKVFATGMSNGAMMSYRLACEAADIFAAIAPVAGTDGVVTCTPTQPVSVLHIHALDDTHVLFEGGAGEDAFADVSQVTDFTSVADSLALWLDRNDITAPAVRTLSVPGAYCDSYERPDGIATVTLCVTETGGHSWPGSTVGRILRDKNPSQAISANELIWEFFSTHQRNI